MRESTGSDYAWVRDWLGGAFCITLVRGLDAPEVLRRFGGEREQPRTLTAIEAGELAGFHGDYQQVVRVAAVDGWSVAVEGEFEGWRPEVLRVMSDGTEAVSVMDDSIEGYFQYSVDGTPVVEFEVLFSLRRTGSQPDLLLALMRAVGLDPDSEQPPPGGDRALAALALAERVTGVRLDASSMVGAPLLGSKIVPLLGDVYSSFAFADGARDAELAAAIDGAEGAVQRMAAATAARQAVDLAQLDDDPVVVEALTAAEAGHARVIDDHSPLGWRIRTWTAEVRTAERMRAEAPSLDQQERRNALDRTAGQPVRPLKDPSPWLGANARALRARRRAGQAVRAALLADSRTALYATLDQVRTPADQWPQIRAAVLEVLRSGPGLN